MKKGKFMAVFLSLIMLFLMVVPAPIFALESEGKPNLLPNGDFSDELDQWDIWWGKPSIDKDDEHGNVLRVTNQDSIVVNTQFGMLEYGNEYKLSVTYFIDEPLSEPDDAIVSFCLDWEAEYEYARVELNKSGEWTTVSTVFTRPPLSEHKGPKPPMCFIYISINFRVSGISISEIRIDEYDGEVTPTPTEEPTPTPVEEEFILTIGNEKPGGAGIKREITIECIGDSTLNGKFLFTRTIYNKGENAKINIMFVSITGEKATVSVDFSGTVVDVWLIDGISGMMPVLFNSNLGAKIFATASSE